MYVNIHDYSGHPFQVQLSRELAGRGFRVDHTYCADYETGRGRLTRADDDPATLEITGLSAGRDLEKYKPVNRLRFERAYASAWKRFAREKDFDLVVMCNVPLFSSELIRRYLTKCRQRWILWHQDVYSRGVIDEVTARLPIGRRPVAQYVDSLERRLVRDANRIVTISSSFLPEYERWGVDLSKVDVIPNWAPLDEITPTPRSNSWTRSHHLPDGTLRLMYSGTLGRKHNPLLLLALLDEVKSHGVDACLIVCSQGAGADDLASAAGDRKDVRVLGFQPAEDFAEVLGSGDVVVALLEPSASQFSVPSKVLSYVSAGRAVVGLMPEDNPASDDVVASGGFAATPDPAGVARAAQWIAASVASDRLAAIGQRARAYAEERFDVAAICDRFEAVFTGSVSGHAGMKAREASKRSATDL